MKTTLVLMSAAILLTSGSALARQDREFPSSAIRPLISGSESGDAYIPRESAAQRNESATTQRTILQSSQVSCDSSTTVRDGVDTSDRTNCQSNAAKAQASQIRSEAPQIRSEIPQLRAFRQPTTARYAP